MKTLSENTKNEIEGIVEAQIDLLFMSAHDTAETQSGDITPHQAMRLDKIKEDLLSLVVEQVKQNL